MKRSFPDIIMGIDINHKTGQGWTLMLALLLTLCGSVTAWADSVEVEQPSRATVAGENLYFAIHVKMDADREVDVSKIQYQGRPLPFEIRSQGSSSFSIIINGRAVRQSSESIRSYIFTVPTESPGIISLPASTITVDGKEYQIEPLTFTVLPKPSSENLLFVTEILNPQPFYYPTQVIEVACRIYFRQFPGGPMIEEINLPIFNHRSFSLIPPEGVNMEVPINGVPTQVNRRIGEENFKGQTYNLFSFNLKFRLMDPGDFAFNNSIKMQVETGRVLQQRSFFGNQEVRERKSIYADSPTLQLTVKELPKENVPASFNGAIGNFKIKVTPSSDTDIKVGDPITLAIEISGRGTWDFVQSPPLHKIAAITDYFKVSSDPVAGEVAADGSSKTFQVRVRVKSQTVKEIPPIPFTYFDLVSMKYVTVYSEAMPITVFEASGAARVVDYSQPKPAENGTAAESPEPPPETPVSPERQEYTPPPPEPIQIADNVAAALLEKDDAPHYYRLLFALAPLLAVLILFLTVLYRRRDVSQEKLRQEKAKNAFNNFLHNMAPTEKADFEALSFYRDLGRNLQQFLEERFMLEMAALDRETLQPLFDSGRLQQAEGEALLALADTVDERRYTGSGQDREEALDLLRQVKEILKRC